MALQELSSNRISIVLAGLLAALFAVFLHQQQQLEYQSQHLRRLRWLESASQSSSWQELTCPNPQSAEPPKTFLAPSERSMSLASSAKGVAASFEYGAEDANVGVKEFLRQMG